MRLSEVARRLAISRAGAYRLVRSGQLPASKSAKPGASCRSDFDAYVDANSVPRPSGATAPRKARLMATIIDRTMGVVRRDKGIRRAAAMARLGAPLACALRRCRRQAAERLLLDARASGRARSRCETRRGAPEGLARHRQRSAPHGRRPPRALADRGRRAEAPPLEPRALSGHRARAARPGARTRTAPVADPAARRACVRRAGRAARGHRQPCPRPPDDDARSLGGLAPLRPRDPPRRARAGRRLAPDRAQPGGGCRPAASQPAGDAAADARPRRAASWPQPAAIRSRRCSCWR